MDRACRAGSLLGLGVGYPLHAASTGRERGSPLATMRSYRDRMDSQTSPPPPDVAYSVVIAANGPKTLALAGEIAAGVSQLESTGAVVAGIA